MRSKCLFEPQRKFLLDLETACVILEKWCYSHSPKEQKSPSWVKGHRQTERAKLSWAGCLLVYGSQTGSLSASLPQGEEAGDQEAAPAPPPPGASLGQGEEAGSLRTSTLPSSTGNSGCSGAQALWHLPPATPQACRLVAIATSTTRFPLSSGLTLDIFPIGWDFYNRVRSY